MLLALRAAVLSKSLLLGDVWVQVHQRGHQDVGGIHDFVAHDDLRKRHVVQLLLGVRLHRLDLRLPCARKENFGTEQNSQNRAAFRNPQSIRDKMGLELHLALQGTQQTMGQDWDLSVLSAIGNRAHGQHTERAKTSKGWPGSEVNPC